MQASGNGPQSLGQIAAPHSAGLYAVTARFSVTGSNGIGLRVVVGTTNPPTAPFAFTTNMVTNGDTLVGTVFFFDSNAPLFADVVDDVSGPVTNNPPWTLKLHIVPVCPTDITEQL